MPNEIYARITKLRAENPTKSQRRLIDFFMNADLRSTAYLSITELAECADVAEATVLRFCRALGFSRYQQFRIALTEENAGNWGEIADKGCLDALEEGYRTTLVGCRKQLTETLLAQACATILSARSVCCFGAGYSRLATLEMHSRFMATGIPSQYESDAFLMRKYILTCGENDLFVLFAASSCTLDTVELAALAHAQGMRVLVAACGTDSPLIHDADLVLMTVPSVKEDRDRRFSEFFVSEAILLSLHEAKERANLMAATAIS